MPFVGGPDTRITNSKMADGRHLGKIERLLYLSRGSSDFDKIWHDDIITQNKAISPLKVTDFGTNRKLICDFLSVININLHAIYQIP